MSFSIVTALIDINRYKWDPVRPFSKYMEFLTQVLYIDAPIYVFIEKDNIDFILSIRGDKPTYVIPITFEELLMYKYYDSIQNIMKTQDVLKLKVPKSPEHTQPEYNVVTNSKVEFLYRASQYNVFNTDYFIWLDAGYGHGKLNICKNFKWNPCDLLKTVDKICVVFRFNENLINKDFHKFFYDHIDVVNGGVFGGSIGAIKNYFKYFYETVDLYNSLGITDDDQYSTAMVYRHRPELFKIYYNEDWYCAFSIFS